MTMRPQSIWAMEFGTRYASSESSRFVQLPPHPIPSPEGRGRPAWTGEGRKGTTSVVPVGSLSPFEGLQPLRPQRLKPPRHFER